MFSPARSDDLIDVLIMQCFSILCDSGFLDSLYLPATFAPLLPLPAYLDDADDDDAAAADCDYAAADTDDDDAWTDIDSGEESDDGECTCYHCEPHCVCPESSCPFCDFIDELSTLEAGQRALMRGHDGELHCWSWHRTCCYSLRAGHCAGGGYQRGRRGLQQLRSLCRY